MTENSGKDEKGQADKGMILYYTALMLKKQRIEIHSELSEIGGGGYDSIIEEL